VVALLPGTAPGAAADYVAAPAEALAAAPRAGELADAAALPLPGLTAWQSLFEHPCLKLGQGVLINGAGGAVGGYAVQLAAQAGAKVTATASARSRDRIRSYGADPILDYTRDPVRQAVAGQRFDVVLNLAPTSPEEIAQLVDLVVDGGAFVSITTPGLRTPGAGCGLCRPSYAATPPSSPSWSPASTTELWRSRWPSGGHWPTWPRFTPSTPSSSPRWSS
jgi:NADPH:quinone reductase-like Zn-dependent oxidoreductase